MATKVLFLGTILYFVTVLFSFFRLPGTLELGIFCIPLVSLLLMRYYRMNFKMEKNMYIKYFTLIMSVFICISFLVPIFFFKENQFAHINEFQLISWMMVVLLSIVYYLYLVIRAPGKSTKMGYLILILTGVVFLIEAMISFTLADNFELKLITYFSLIVLSVYIYFQFLWNKPLPKLELGHTLLIGAILVYSIDLCYLLLIN